MSRTKPLAGAAIWEAKSAWLGLVMVVVGVVALVVAVLKPLGAAESKVFETALLVAGAFLVVTGGSLVVLPWLRRAPEVAKP